MRSRLITAILVCSTSVFAQRANVILTSTFDSGSIAMWQGVQAYYAWSNMFKTDTTRLGTAKAYRFELRYTDAPNRRSEILDSAITQNQRWYGFSIFTPTAYVPDVNDEIITQWHGVDNTGLEPPITLRTLNGRYYISIYYIDDSLVQQNITYDLGVVVLNTWTDWVWHIKFSYTTGGYIELWKNGGKVLTYLGRNCYNEIKYPYLKFGIYKPLWGSVVNPTVKNRVIFFDEVRVGGPNAKYDDVAPITIVPGTSPINYIFTK